MSGPSWQPKIPIGASLLSVTTPPPPNAREALTVAVLAGLGAVARFSLGVLLPSPAVVLLAVNVAGSYAMAKVRNRALGTGFLGGFTSFSAFISVLDASTTAHAIVYAVATVVLCVGAFLLGAARPRKVQ